MRSIARRTAVGAALLLVMPVAVWISGWRWQPGEQSWLLKAAFWVTETVTQPWGVITWPPGYMTARKTCSIS